MQKEGVGDRIDSWKGIAAFLGRGIRTVQRWEREEGLPVHRLQHDKLGSIYAYENELKEWWAKRGELFEEEPAEVVQSVAVLPFSDVSQQKDQEFFCEGMADELIGALSRTGKVKVAARSSSFRFKGSDLGAREIGRRLRTAYLLEGGVRKAGERLRITVQLTDADSGYQVWSESYDRQLGDVFLIQADIAQNVAHALEVRLTPEERAALKKPPTRVVGAYEYYLRGRQFYFRFAQGDMECAIQLFRQAIELDPEYPLAYAGLADGYSYLYLHTLRADKLRDEAEKASRRAVELDPASAQAQASRGLALSLWGRSEESEAAFCEAIRLDPNLFEAHFFYARQSFAEGRKELAIREYERAMELRPDDYQAPLLVAQSYEDLGFPDKARASRLRGVEVAEQHLKMNPDDARAMYMAANGMAALGMAEKAKLWADRAWAMRREDAMTLYNVGCIYSLLGLKDEAITVLGGAVKHGLRHKGWFINDSNLDPLREDVRFQRLVDSID